MRPGAGTKSKVSFVAAGDEMDTGIRELSDGIRTVTLHKSRYLLRVEL